MLGVFTRKKDPAVSTESAEADPAAAEREEIQSLLGHSPRTDRKEGNGHIEDGTVQNGRHESV